MKNKPKEFKARLVLTCISGFALKEINFVTPVSQSQFLKSSLFYTALSL
jgi:hypothetical protein